MAETAPAPLTRLSEEFFAQAVLELAQRDPDLALILEKYGSPSLWVRGNGFPTLVYIILDNKFPWPRHARCISDYRKRSAHSHPPAF